MSHKSVPVSPTISGRCPTPVSPISSDRCITRLHQSLLQAVRDVSHVSTSISYNQLELPHTSLSYSLDLIHKASLTTTPLTPSMKLHSPLRHLPPPGSPTHHYSLDLLHEAPLTTTTFTSSRKPHSPLWP